MSMVEIDGNSSNQRAKAVPNVWMLPVPYVTHVLCFYQFANNLARHGLAVTLLSMDDEIQRLHAFENGMLLDRLKREGLDIHLQTLGPKPPLGLLNNDSSPSNRDRSILCFMDAAEDAFIKFMRSEVECGRKPTCFISDLWFGGARDAATECGIPAWLLSPYSAGYLSAITYITQLQSKGILKLPDSHLDKDNRDEIISIPGLPLLRIRDLPHFYFKQHHLYERASMNPPSLLKCDVVLLSTFSELECTSIRECEKFLKALAVRDSRKILTVWSIGPTFDFLSYRKGSKVDEGGQIEKHPSIEFLDSHAPSSVLLVMFGTTVHHSREQIEEIARGLENSQQPFLYVLDVPKVASGVSAGNGVSSVLPPDCIESTRGRGLFLQGWVPQKKLLAHPATRGFFSHCGQNSVLESTCLGVPLLAWPHTSDQFINCRILVDDAQVALEVCRGPDDFVDRKEVERSVRALFHSEEGAIVRKNALEMGESAERSVGENGSTWKNLQALVALIRSK